MDNKKMRAGFEGQRLDGQRRTLDLLPGLRWEGKLHVLCRGRSGGYLVDFDAIDLRAHQSERYVMDRVVLTEKQLKDWTGWEEG